MGVGLVTTVRLALNPELRRAIIEAVAERLPLEDLLDELVLDADVVPDADDGDSEAGVAGRAGDDEVSDDEEPDEAGAEPQEGETDRARRHAGSGQRRRNVSRSRGDTNGRGGRKPPNRGTRA